MPQGENPDAFKTHLKRTPKRVSMSAIRKGNVKNDRLSAYLNQVAIVLSANVLHCMAACDQQPILAAITDLRTVVASSTISASLFAVVMPDRHFFGSSALHFDIALCDSRNERF
jgi:hypothetical protein